MILEYIINDLNKDRTIKSILKEKFYMSDRLIAKLKNTKQIYINNKPVYINTDLHIGDTLTIDLCFDECSDNIIPTDMKLNILFEDDSFLILNKSAGMPVHPSMEHYNDSISNGVKFYFNSTGLKRKIRPVNRLDRNTSGIVIFAKNQYVQECLIKQMKTNTMKKEYLAIVEGKLSQKKLTIDEPIARKENSIIERCVSSNGKNAITEFEVLNEYNNYSLVKCILKTGRTHQIRVHSSYINSPIIGDDLYGKKSNIINRQALHAYRISFVHPILNEKIEIMAELPDDMKRIL